MRGKATFAQEEVDGMIAFYRSPAGAALIQKSPALFAKMARLTHRSRIRRSWKS